MRAGERQPGADTRPGMAVQAASGAKLTRARERATGAFGRHWFRGRRALWS